VGDSPITDERDGALVVSEMVSNFETRGVYLVGPAKLKSVTVRATMRALAL